MKYSPVVKSVISQLQFPEGKMEKFFDDAMRHCPGPKACSLKDYENVNWCSAEATVRGVVQIVFANKGLRGITCIDVPATARFLVTGTKLGEKGFRLSFLNSMS